MDRFQRHGISVRDPFKYLWLTPCPATTIMTSLENAWARWTDLKNYIGEGNLIVLDGGVGTEIERRAGSKLLDAKGWCCAAHVHGTWRPSRMS